MSILTSWKKKKRIFCFKHSKYIPQNHCYYEK